MYASFCVHDEYIVSWGKEYCNICVSPADISYSTNVHSPKLLLHTVRTYLFRFIFLNKKRQKCFSCFPYGGGGELFYSGENNVHIYFYAWLLHTHIHMRGREGLACVLDSAVCNDTVSRIRIGIRQQARVGALMIAACDVRRNYSVIVIHRNSDRRNGCGSPWRRQWSRHNVSRTFPSPTTNPLRGRGDILVKNNNCIASFSRLNVHVLIQLNRYANRTNEYMIRINN